MRCRPKLFWHLEDGERYKLLLQRELRNFDEHVQFDQRLVLLLAIELHGRQRKLVHAIQWKRLLHFLHLPFNDL